MVALTTPEIMQSFSSNMNSKTLHEGILGMYDPYFSCRDTDSSSATAATDENGLLNPMNSPIFRELLSFPDTDPLFVSPSNQGPSKKIASCLSVVFPNVPERAKQNNILLTKKEIPWLNYYINKFDKYCPDYDVTIVVDGGGSMEEEIQRMVVELGLKAHFVERVGESCVILMTNSTHEYASSQLYFKVGRSDKLKYWEEMTEAWGKTGIEIDNGPVYDFIDRLSQCNPSPCRKNIGTMAYRAKRPDASCGSSYNPNFCEALGMNPAPTLAIECTNSKDFRKLFHDCIVWISGALLQVHTVLGANNSPDTYSVDILNFDLTVERMMELARELEGEQYAHTRAALCQVIKMKSGVQLLHLKLLDHLLSNPELRKGKITQQDIDSTNQYLQEEISQVQGLYPGLKIHPLELSQFPSMNFRRFQPFINDIKAEITYYKEVMNALEYIKFRMCPQEAIAQCAYTLVSHTMPMTLGPISEDFILPQDVKLEIPIRALAGIGDGAVEIVPEVLEHYVCEFTPDQVMEHQTYKYTPIPLHWINDPSSLAVERGLPVEHMSPAKYNSIETLDGEIKFCYLTDEALHHFVLKELGFKGITSREYAIWMLIRNRVQNEIQKPFLEDRNVEAQNNVVQREQGHLWHRTRYRRVFNRGLPTSCPRKSPMRPAIRGIHTTALPFLPRRRFYPRWYPTRLRGTLWTTISRLPRH